MYVNIKGFLPSGTVLPIGYKNAFNKIRDDLNEVFNGKYQAKVCFIPSAISDDDICVDIETEVEFPLELTKSELLTMIISKHIKLISNKHVDFIVRPNSWFVLVPEKIDLSVHQGD